jgi:branched-chain amino acid transport system permease protein
MQGILLGGLFAMSAVGLSLAFGVLRVVNLAHGDLMTLGGYLAFLTMEHTGLNTWFSLLIVVPGMGVIGYIVQRALLQRALRMGELAPLMVTFGIAIIIPNSLMQIFSSNVQQLPVGSLAVSSIRINDSISLGTFPILTLTLSILLIGSLQQFLARTKMGRYMRAAADDSEVLRLMGVDHRKVYGLAMGIAFATLALAGVLFGMRQGGVSPFDGQLTVLFAFETVIIGGLGSLWGTLLGGIVLGVAQTVSGQISPEIPLLVGHLVFLAVLAFRPNGLMGRQVLR